MPGVRYWLVLEGTAPDPPPPEERKPPLPPPPPPPLNRISYVPSPSWGIGYCARRGNVLRDCAPSFGMTVKKHCWFAAPAGALREVNMFMLLSNSAEHCGVLPCANAGAEVVANASSA